ANVLVLLVGMTETVAFASDGQREINQNCATQTGCFPGDTPGFPVTITASSSCRLTSDLVTPNDGIRIEISGVDIDLVGFSLVGPNAVDTLGICNGGANLGVGQGITTSSPFVGNTVVRNGRVTKLQNGIRPYDQTRVERVSVDRTCSVGVKA
ncbi:hypothetical protein K2X89_12600, partial [Myxococcota bacterium]|nr:hypothetical protein [Myxococcota bacterium]